MTTQAMLINRNGSWHLETPEGRRMDTYTQLPEGQALPAEPRNIDHIIALVVERTGVSAHDIRSERRDRPVVRARYLVMWLVRQATKLSTSAIGELLNRDHSTVLYALGKTDRVRAEDEAWRRMSDELLAQLQAHSANNGDA